MQLNIKEIADKADMIINGYAFTKGGEYVRILNLNCVNHAAAIYGGKIVDTNMDDAVQTVMIQCELWTDNNDMKRGENDIENYCISYISYDNDEISKPVMVAEPSTKYGQE